jgi:hypothetical protein
MSGTKIMGQRKHKRFECPESIVINPDNVCQLINISTGGLSFKCSRVVELPTKWSLDIIIAGSYFRIKQFPVELLWKKLDDDPRCLSMPAENVGVKFDELNQSQEAMLEYLFSQL